MRVRYTLGHLMIVVAVAGMVLWTVSLWGGAMRWTEDDLRVVDPLKMIRDRPGMFLPDGDRGTGLAKHLEEEARLLGAAWVQVERLADWYLVGSDMDWCRVGRFRPSDPLDQFRRAWPFPEAGVNSIRSEILVTAFAEDVFTGTASERRIVQGGEPPPQVWELVESRGWRRVVGFRLGKLA